jgi:hypothetical protein
VPFRFRLQIWGYGNAGSSLAIAIGSYPSDWEWLHSIENAVLGTPNLTAKTWAITTSDAQYSHVLLVDAAGVDSAHGLRQERTASPAGDVASAEVWTPFIFAVASGSTLAQIASVRLTGIHVSQVPLER